MARNGYRLGQVMRGQADVTVDDARIGKVRISLTGHGWDALDELGRMISEHEYRSAAGDAVYNHWQAAADA